MQSNYLSSWFWVRSRVEPTAVNAPGKPHWFSSPPITLLWYGFVLYSATSLFGITVLTEETSICHIFTQARYPFLPRLKVALLINEFISRDFFFSFLDSSPLQLMKWSTVGLSICKCCKQTFSKSQLEAPNDQ